MVADVLLSVSFPGLDGLLPQGLENSAVCGLKCRFRGFRSHTVS